ncbi:SNF2 family N-terminal domain-containing protein [Spinellus fusiger]|nr:SNF2 family N-terminal domain-containing protein [Spinellus fusiger]
MNLATEEQHASVDSDSTRSNSPISTSQTTPTVMSDQEIEVVDEEDTITRSMIEVENELAQVTVQEEEKRIEEAAQAQFDTTVKEQRMKRLNFLLEKSSAYATILGRKMAKQQEEAREKAAKIDAANEASASASANTSANANVLQETLNAAKKKETAKAKQTINLRKRKVANDADYQLGEYINENDVKRRKQSDNSVSKAIQQETHKNSADTEKEAKLKPTISARQPTLVTGGILRDYQLAGVEWLTSLWENGLNGILADEMGLGKTLQTISFIAHLKAMNVSGPYLIVTPLSTLANWVNEFKRFTPQIPVLLYHGTKEERQHIINRKISKKKETAFDFPIIVTSYEIIMNDRKYLQRYNWKYIVVDEGHRIKNLNCKLIKELKAYSSANRLLLTGTPLQNNLAELWSLLNFLLPDIFDDLEIFQSWFDFSDINQKSGQDRIMREEEEDNIVSSLHTILRPFLLRRLKADVEHSLPKKKEYLLYAPLTKPQKELYDAILKRDLRDYLIHRKVNIDDEEKTESESTAKEEVNGPRHSGRHSKTLNYKEQSDKEFFSQKASIETEITTEAILQAGKKHAVAVATKQVNGMHLQNLVMQLRKVCNHPFLFDWPVDPKTNTHVLNNELAAQSGKVLLLDRLLTALFERNHKVLIFSQMTKMLDILEDWATGLKGWPICRLDGSVSQESRRQQIETFNKPESEVKLFLLSTRAGGLGINLTAADTVIIFDSDWNPQMDLQAQDRVHRIGQTKPVLIYRFVTGNTVEDKMLEKATAKRRLEKLVIHKGKFKSPATGLPSSKKEQENTVRELADILASEDGQQVQIVSQGDKVISDKDLEMLLDRSKEVFEETNARVSEGFKEMNTAEMVDQKNEILATRI